MAKTTKKASLSLISTAPKKSYAKSHQEFIGNPTMQGGKTAKAKAEYEKAVKGGAAKAAKKLVKPTTKSVTRVGGLYAGTVDQVVTNPRTAEKKAMAARIINDKSKTATRAKIIEMNAMKKTKKSK